MKPAKCISLGGRIFGHKFIKSCWGYVYRSVYCYRCGMPQGGWR